MRKKIKTLLQFDGNHLSYRALYKFNNLKTLDGVMTSVIYGNVYIAESLIRKFSPDKVIITFDGGRSDFRLKLLPDYKKRDKKIGFDYEDFKRQREVSMEIFASLGIPVVMKKGYEADDIITLISKRFSKKGYKTILITADKDFNQLISNDDLDNYLGGFSVFNTSKGKELNYNNLVEEVGYKPEQTVDYLSLLGDNSDNIPGYPGIGPKKANQILSKYGNVKAFIDSGDKLGKMDLTNLKETMSLNKKLIDLKYFYRKFLIKEPIPYIKKKFTFDINKLKSICSEYEISSFIKPQFIKTFKNL